MIIIMKKILKPALLVSILLSNSALTKVSACEFEPMIGSMCTFAFNFAPRGWALADGQILPINQNQSLYSLLGTTYGGDGRTTFALPDLRGRAIIGAGEGPGLSVYALGSRIGQETVVLTLANIPSHNHPQSTIEVSTSLPSSSVSIIATLRASTSVGDSPTPSGALFASDLAGANGYSSGAPDVSLSADGISMTVSGTVSADTATSGNTGSGQAHTNLMPYQTVSWAIALTGLFPSRS
jgi:microcystin-dependent protein